jgi:major type 1 subunit fimbrin (pilin)
LFVKTGPIASGVVSFSDFPNANVTVSNPSGGVLSYTSVTGSMSFVVAGCQVSIPDVSLGSHKVSEFKSQPYTSNPANVAVQLTNCPQTVPIRYQIDQMTGYANQAQSIVNVTGGASGVGVQLLDSSGAAPSPMGSQQLIGSGSLNYSLMFKARYYKTGATVSPGKANAVMGFTIFYQ